jgi:hypothetical protein
MVRASSDNGCDRELAAHSVPYSSSPALTGVLT